MSVSPVRKAATALAVSLLALTVGAGSTMGATELAKSGKTGVWTLADTLANPAAACIYDLEVGNDLDLMETRRSPRVLARDRTTRRDGQWVGIRIVFQQSREDGGAGGWKSGKATKLVKKFAYDNKPAGVGPRAWQLKAADKTGTPHYRAIAIIRWYKPGSKTKVQGTARVRFDNYAVRFINDLPVEQDRCLPEP
jgi:hypothetical protein